MKMNPVYKRELKVGSRSIRMAVILLAFNGILSAVALFNMYSAVEQVKMTAEIQYSRFLQLYVFVVSLEFIMLMFIMPALTSNSISGERERQTLDLMLTTTMKPGEVVLGQAAAAFTTMLLAGAVQLSRTLPGVCIRRHHGDGYGPADALLCDGSAAFRSGRRIFFIHV